MVIIPRENDLGDVADAIVDLGVASDELVEDWKFVLSKKR